MIREPEDFWDHPQPFTLHTEVRAEDIDGLRHTNNTVYVHWCQEVAWGHSVALGLDLECYQRLDRAMVITHSEYHYLKASREGDEVVVGTWISDWNRRTSMGRRFQIIRTSDGTTLLRGAMQFACIEISSGRARRMPAEFICGYEPAVLTP